MNGFPETGDPSPGARWYQPAGDGMDRQTQQRLLGMARASIEQGLATDQPAIPDPGVDDAALLAPGASFVMLNVGGRHRGCAGSSDAVRPLLVDVSENAFNAAFRDPQAPPLEQRELPRLCITIDLVGSPEPLPVVSEADLAQQLRPGIDGLTLTDGLRSATFPPSMWDRLPNPADFVRQLKVKGGWEPPDHWGPEIIAERYRVERFSEQG